MLLLLTTTNSDVRSSYSFLDYPHISWIDFDYIGNHAFNTDKIKNKIIMDRDEYNFLMKEKFNDFSITFNDYCNQGISPDEAFEKACKENNINNWL